MQVPQRRADHQHGKQLLAGGDQIGQRVVDRVEQGVLQQDVVEGVAGQGQFGEDRQPDAVVVALAIADYLMRH